ncbi:hypothetical protein GJAV_G00125130 [Gymnothorax javanicus]|nr:hypothetical protein GJAV_G00125130 [Gymnothorax javanicus]
MLPRSTTHSRLHICDPADGQTDRQIGCTWATATTNLDLERKRTGHFRSSWQQHANVLGGWSRPECVQELHGEAQLNLQRLLREFGERLYEETELRGSSQGSEGSPETPDHTATFHQEGSLSRCLPDQTGSVGVSGRDLSCSRAGRSRLGPPVPEKPRWLLRPIAPAQVTLAYSAAEGDQIEEASRFFALSTDPADHLLPQRKTSSDLARRQREFRPISSGPEMMENMALMFSSWNGPRGSTFCPNWDGSFSPYLLNPDPITIVIPQGKEQGSSQQVESGEDGHYRERSFAVREDSGSFSPGSCAGAVASEGQSHSLSYPSSGSEQGSSPVSTSTTRAATPMATGQGRECCRSISLRKLKKKPVPPARSVSLGKTAATKGEEMEAKGHTRPRSLCLPRDLGNSVPPDVILSSRPRSVLFDMPFTAVAPAAANGMVSTPPSQTKCANHHRSPSGSSTAEVPPPHGSSESLPSPLRSPTQNSPTQLSPTKPKRLMSPSSGYSSLSDTPTPTVPTSAIMGPSPLGCRLRPKVPERKSSLPPAQARERAARLRLSCEVPASPAPQDPPSGPRPKTTAGRRHSDTSTAAIAIVLPQKLSPGQVAMPLVTQTDLRNVRLRSVGLPDPEVGLDGASRVIPEEQDPAQSPVKAPNPKPKPPIAAKPVLPRRPVSLVLSPTPLLESPPNSPNSPKDKPRPTSKRPKSLMLNHSLSPEPPTSPPAVAEDRAPPLTNIYKVLRKRKSKKCLAPTSPTPVGAPECESQPLNPPQEAERLASPSSPESRDKSRTLPTRMTISCLAELDRKQSKVPPPVPRKPSVLLLPVNGVRGSGDSAELTAKANGAQTRQDPAGPAGAESVKAPLTQTGVEQSQDGPEEDFDDVFVSSSTAHTTEDLFTIIHRSKRKVLGRKEPLDLFGSRQSLSSPAKAEQASGSARSSSRNDSFMAMLQKRNGRNGPAGRTSAAEILQSTNPLARRAVDCPPHYTDSSTSCPKAPQEH